MAATDSLPACNKPEQESGSDFERQVQLPQQAESGDKKIIREGKGVTSWNKGKKILLCPKTGSVTKELINAFGALPVDAFQQHLSP